MYKICKIRVCCFLLVMLNIFLCDNVFKFGLLRFLSVMIVLNYYYYYFETAKSIMIMLIQCVCLLKFRICHRKGKKKSIALISLISYSLTPPNRLNLGSFQSSNIDVILVTYDKSKVECALIPTSLPYIMRVIV